jgi:hypothetical protein
MKRRLQSLPEAPWRAVVTLAAIGLLATWCSGAKAEGAKRPAPEDPVVTEDLLKPRLRARNGEFVTEFGMGYKLSNTSIVLLPECETALISSPTEPKYDYRRASCGGDFPAFIGWPIAYEWQVGEVYSVRVGWFHYSNWFDGGRDHESHMDLVAAVLTVHWGELR